MTSLEYPDTTIRVKKSKNFVLKKFRVKKSKKFVLKNRKILC